MGLFDDTIRDARRPLGFGWVQRVAADEAPAAAPPQEPVQELPEEPADTGMQTVFRFQKAGAPAGVSREAPSRSGMRPAAGDPLTAGSEIESPSLSARNVRETDMSAEGDRRTGDLATGHEKGIRPIEVAAAAAVSESNSDQSEVSSGRVGAEDDRGVPISETTSGSLTTARLGVEAFESRPAGRGAPSEPTAVGPWTGPADGPAGSAAARAVAAVAVDKEDEAVAALPPTGTRGEVPAPFLGEALAGGDHSGDEQSTQRAAPLPGRAFATGRIETSATGQVDTSPPASVSAHRGEAQPSGLFIGRIDVLVTAPATPTRPQPADPGGRGFLSRNYLKRL